VTTRELIAVTKGISFLASSAEEFVSLLDFRTWLPLITEAKTAADGSLEPKSAIFVLASCIVFGVVLSPRTLDNPWFDIKRDFIAQNAPAPIDEHTLMINLFSCQQRDHLISLYAKAFLSAISGVNGVTHET
jgi:hypothetical protein